MSVEFDYHLSKSLKFANYFEFKIYTIYTFNFYLNLRFEYLIQDSL